MKKFLCILLSISFIFILIGCGKTKEETKENEKKYLTFQGKILSIEDGYYLVEPSKDAQEFTSFQEVLVPMKSINSSRELVKDDMVKIKYYGIILEQDTTKIRDVYEIKLVE